MQVGYVEWTRRESGFIFSLTLSPSIAKMWLEKCSEFGFFFLSKGLGPPFPFTEIKKDYLSIKSFEVPRQQSTESST